MTQLKCLWEKLKFVSDHSDLTQEQIDTLLPILKAEAKAREAKRVRYLLQRSGIKRIKLFEEFDWTFNPKLPRQKVLAFFKASWIENPQNLLLIGPSGVGTEVPQECHKLLKTKG